MRSVPHALMLTFLVCAHSRCTPSGINDLQETNVLPLTVSQSPLESSYDRLAVSTGWMHTCFYRHGVMRCTGYNNHGQLGYGDTVSRGLSKQEQINWLPTVPFLEDHLIVQVAAGALSTCILDQQHKIYCWGYPMGLLQGPTTADKTSFLPLEVTLRSHTGIAQLATSRERWGEGHHCVIYRDGQMTCFGNNDDGQLGMGDRVSRFPHPKDPATYPDIDLGQDSFVVQVALGARHTCALLATGQVKCFGDNTFGALGLEDTVTRGTDPKHMGQQLQSVDLGFRRKAVRITAGDTHTCALLDNQTVKCWGGNTFGQLGFNDKLSRGDKSKSMGDHLPSVYFGPNVAITALDAGLLHTCVITAHQEVKCFGDNFGALGIESPQDVGSRFYTSQDAMPNVQLGDTAIPIAIHCGGHHSCVILQDNTAKCFGHNWHGQLGLGDQLPRGSRPQTMGNDLPRIHFSTSDKT